MTDFLKKLSLSEFSKSEFTEFVSNISSEKAKDEAQSDAWLEHFIAIAPHPAKSDLIYWPEEGADDSPEGIVAEIERYCRENDLPCFKDG